MLSAPSSRVVPSPFDRQIPGEIAFAGPPALHQRMGEVGPALIAGTEQDAFVAICAEPPVVHRFLALLGRQRGFQAPG